MCNAGVHGDASLFSATQPPAPMAAATAEPQLTLRGAGGARRWGPAHFEAAPAAASSAAATARAPVTGTSSSTDQKVFLTFPYRESYGEVHWCLSTSKFLQLFNCGFQP